MRVKLGDLREHLKVCLEEAGGGVHVKRQPFQGSNLNQDFALDDLRWMDNHQNGEEDIAPHLRDDGSVGEDTNDDEDRYGPVPPTEGEPYVGQDPFARDTGPSPTPGIRRG